MHPLAIVLAMSFAAATASAHRIDGHVSRSGIEFLEQQVPHYVPESLNPPEISRSFLCAKAVQRDTSAAIELHDLALTMPRDGVMRLELEISVEAEGELFLDNLYSCFGEATCRDRLSLSHGRVAIDFRIEVAGGAPRITVHDVDLSIDSDDIAIELSGCSIDGVVNTVIGWARSLALDLILGIVERIAAKQLAPMLEDLFADFVTFEGQFGPSTIQAELFDAHVGQSGLFISGDVTLQSNSQQVADCLQHDPGPPKTKPGLPPSLAEGVPAHLGLAINLGLLDDVLYNVWRSGLMCLSDAHLAAVGIDLELDDHLGTLLPGFPPGTRFSLELRVMEPPRVEGSESDDAALTVVGRGIEADLIGRYAGGADTIHVVVDLEASARVRVDRDVSALVLQPEDVKITRLEIDDTVAGESLGIDAARLAHMLETYLIPRTVSELGAVPVSDSIIGFEGHYVLVRDVFTTEGYIAAKVDLFRAPDNDKGRPTTAIESRPEGLVSVHDAVLRVTGSDPEIPSELLRYRVVVDGEERPLSFVRDVPIGQVGASGRYRVEVSAVDLAGNEDPNPIVVHMDVDGIAPVVQIEGGRIQQTSGPSATISWRQNDDLTASEELVPRVRLYRVRDTANILDDELLSEAELEPGAISHELSVRSGELYRVEIRVRDEAGNDGVASTLLSTRAGGCSVSVAASGSGAGAAALLLVIFVAFAFTRRRGAA